MLRDINLTRRAALAGLASAAVSPLLPSRAWSRDYRTKVGALEVMAISDGVLNVPLAFTLPETPAEEARALFSAHGLPADGIPAQTNVTLVKSGDAVTLIDAGAGSNFQATAGKLAENLETAGISPEAVTRVVFTHAHPDHLWGVLDDFDELRFPKASYVIAAAEWDYWTDPDTVSRVPEGFRGMAAGNGRILKRLEGKIERRAAGDTVAPGLTYVATPGHTPGHMAVMIEEGGERLLIVGDVLTHPAISFSRPDWRMGADHDRDKGAATRHRVLDWLATDRIPFVGFHLPWPGHGAIERNGTQFRYVSR